MTTARWSFRAPRFDAERARREFETYIRANADRIVWDSAFGYFLDIETGELWDRADHIDFIRDVKTGGAK